MTFELIAYLAIVAAGIAFLVTRVIRAHSRAKPRDDWEMMP